MMRHGGSRDHSAETSAFTTTGGTLRAGAKPVRASLPLGGECQDEQLRGEAPGHDGRGA